MPTYIPDRRQPYRDYWHWYDNDLSGLFNVPPNTVNGLDYITPAEVGPRMNYFNAQSNFFSDAMLSELPDELLPYERTLRRIVEHWSIFGEAVITITNGVIRAIRPDYFIPIPSLMDDETFETFYFVFPVLNDVRQPTGRARVIEFNVESGTATVGERNFTEATIGDAESTLPINIDAVYWLRTDDGRYAEMAPLVRELNMRLSMISSSLNKATFAILQIDENAVSNGRTVGRTATDVAGLSKVGLGLTVPPSFVGEESPRYIDRDYSYIQHSMDYIRLLLAQLTLISGVPDYIYGVNLGQPAAETERLLFSGQAKVNRFRRLLEAFWRDNGVDVSYVTEPFTTRTSRLNAIEKLVTLGLISVSEARSALLLGANND